MFECRGVKRTLALMPRDSIHTMLCLWHANGVTTCVGQQIVTCFRAFSECKIWQ